MFLDCFCGSGSALQAAYQNNRQWVGIDSSIEAICATLRRFHIGVEAMGDYVNPVNRQLDDRMLLNPDFFASVFPEKCPIIFEVQDEYLDAAKTMWRQEQ